MWIDQFNALANYTHLYKMAISIGIFFVFVGFKNLFTQYIFHYILHLIHRSKVNQEDSFLLALRNPVKNLLVLLGAYLALQNVLPSNIHPFINDLFRSGIIILFSTAIYALITYYAENEREVYRILNREFDKILIPFLSKVLRVVILALAFVAIASTWGYDVNGFIAGLGLGGLAFALAAKDLLANIFSGIVIIIDKPFSIGDWIKTSEVEGTIEDINFRSTKIRAFDQSIVTVPNSNLVNTPITNYTKRPMRRITFQLGIPYSTPSTKIKICIANIEKLLRAYPGVDQQTVLVKFDSFGDSAIQLFLYFFTKTIVWEEYLTIRQDINLKIMEILEAEGISIALPSSRIYVETPEQSIIRGK